MKTYREGRAGKLSIAGPPRPTQDLLLSDNTHKLLVRSSLLWPQLVTQLACDSLTSIVAMAVRDGAEPCCYGNVPVRELSGFVGSKRLRGMFVWHCFSSNVRVCLRVFACLCLTVRCPRAAVMSASVRDTPSAPPLFLGFRGVRHSNHILCWLTTPLLPWLLAKLLPG